MPPRTDQSQTFLQLGKKEAIQVMIDEKLLTLNFSSIFRHL